MDGSPDRNRLKQAKDLAEYVIETIRQVYPNGKNWYAYGILSQIEEINGNTAELKKYRRLEREAFALAPENAELLTPFNDMFQVGEMVQAMAEAINGNIIRQAEISTFFAEIEGTEMRDLCSLKPVLERMRAGVRDWKELTENLDRISSLVVKMILDRLMTGSAA